VRICVSACVRMRKKEAEKERGGNEAIEKEEGEECRKFKESERVKMMCATWDNNKMKSWKQRFHQPQS